MKDQIEKIQSYFNSHPDIAALVLGFNGGGDSGSIESCRQHAEWKPEDLQTTGDWDGTEVTDTAVTEAADSIAYAALEKQGIDWYNNDGGFGIVVIDRNLKVHLRTETRYTSTTAHDPQCYCASDLKE